MLDLSMPLLVTGGFVGIGWLITRASPQDADAVGHTLSVFALALAMLVLGGTMAKLRAKLGTGRMMHRIEAQSQVDPVNPARPAQDGGTLGHR